MATIEAAELQGHDGAPTPRGEGHTRVDLDDGSFVLASSSAQTDEAMVFVHGFAGSATRTWREFPDILVRRPGRFAQVDAYFWNYESVFNETSRSAGQLRSFLRAILPHPPDSVIKPSFSPFLFPFPGPIVAKPIRENSGTYTRVTLVGHSLGGFIVRRALVDELEEHRQLIAGGCAPPLAQLLLDCDVHLFAPATGGCRLIGLRAFLLEVWGLSTLHKAARSASASYTELRDGHVTRLLRESIASKRLEFGEVQGLSASNYWAEMDRVVSQGAGRIDNDRRHRTVRGRSHNDVCKPSHDYEIPIEVIVDRDYEHEDLLL